MSEQQDLAAFLASKPQEEEKKEVEEEGSDPEKEIKGDFKALVELPEVEVKTGEEGLDCIYKQRGKLFR